MRLTEVSEVGLAPLPWKSFSLLIPPKSSAPNPSGMQHPIGSWPQGPGFLTGACFLYQRKCSDSHVKPHLAPLTNSRDAAANRVLPLLVV